MTRIEFEHEVDEHFGFLTAHGFSRESWDGGREYGVHFIRPGVTVVISREVEGTPWVSLEDTSVRAEKARWSRGSFGLHELVQEVSGGTGTHLDSLKEQGAALKRFGGAVLNGDFAVLHERQQRMREAVERNRGPRA